MQLSPCQTKAKDAFFNFLGNPKQSELVISGYAGTGKTTLVNSLITTLPKYQQVMSNVKNKSIRYIPYITATTRKAVAVIKEQINDSNIDFATIHSALGLIVQNNYSTGETYLQKKSASLLTHSNLLFIDEATFIDDALLKYIRKEASALNIKVVYLGDPCQLISVNANHSPVFSGLIPSVSLTTLMRNNGTISAIAKQYRDTVNTGVFSPLECTDTDVVHVDGDTFKTLIDDAFIANNYTANKSAKIIGWTNERIKEYNEHVSQVNGYKDKFTVNRAYILNNPVIVNSDIIYSADTKVTITELVMHTAYGIDGFYITLNDETTFFAPNDEKEKSALLRRFAKAKQWSEYFQVQQTWLDLRPTYACTVHKSQGSTYDTVFVDLYDIGKNNRPEEVARLLYVAISRAKTKVVLYGELPAKYSGVAQQARQFA